MVNAGIKGMQNQARRAAPMQATPRFQQASARTVTIRGGPVFAWRDSVACIATGANTGVSAGAVRMAQASDWPFIMKTGTNVDYAEGRIRDRSFPDLDFRTWA